MSTKKNTKGLRLEIDEKVYEEVVRHRALDEAKTGKRLTIAKFFEKLAKEAMDIT